MPKQPRTPTAHPAREAQFDILAHKKEMDRLLRENAKLKAKNFTLECELELRPPYAEPRAAVTTMEEVMKAVEAARAAIGNGA